MAKQAAGSRLPGYETTFITRPELSDDALKALRDRMAGIVSQFGGEVVLTEDWGKRKLAYRIQKENRGQYTYVVYTGQGEIVQEIERNLRLHDHVLRFLTVNLEKEFDAEQFCKRRAEIQAAAKRREEEREARREERNRERGERGGYDRGGYDRGGYGDRDRDRGGYEERRSAAAASSDETETATSERGEE